MTFILHCCRLTRTHTRKQACSALTNNYTYRCKSEKVIKWPPNHYATNHTTTRLYGTLPSRVSDAIETHIHTHTHTFVCTPTLGIFMYLIRKHGKFTRVNVYIFMYACTSVVIV